MALKTPKHRLVKCPDCRGSGQQFNIQLGQFTTIGCKKCFGTGKIKQ